MAFLIRYVVKTRVNKSQIHGKGIFATEDIPRGKIIEICDVIRLSANDTKIIDKTSLYDYYFGWGKCSAIALGNGSLYNHSYEPNAKYKKDFPKGKLLFVSIKHIKKGEEITVNYNGDPKIKERVWFDKKK